MKPKFRSLAHCLRITSGLTGGIFLAHTALGDTVWNGLISQDWNDAGNWDNGVPLDAANNVSAIINTATGNFPIYSSGTTQTDWDVFIGNGAGNSGRLDQSAGTLSVGNNNWLFVGASGGNGTYNQTGDANLNAGAINVGAWGSPGATGTFDMNSTGIINAQAGQRGGSVGDASVLVGENGSSGTLNVRNGTVNALASAQFGVGGGSVGNLNVSGGTFNVTGNLQMGRGGSGTSLVTGGTISVTSEFWVGQTTAYQLDQSAGVVSSASWMAIGRENGSNGTYNLSGGTVNAATASGFAVIGSFGGSTGALNVSGSGTFNAANNSQILVGEGGTGSLTVSGTGLVTVNHATEGLRLGAGATGNGTVNLNGGTIQASLVTKGPGSGTFNFNGGTLKATTASTTYLEGLTRANVRNGGAVIDTNGVDVTIGQALLHSDLSGDNAIDGGLTKAGSGALTLTGTSSYTGSTTVDAGSLVINGSISTSLLTTVNNGGILSGSGSVGDLTVASGGTLSPGNSPGVLAVGTTNLQLGSTLSMELNGTTAGTGYDQLNVTGSATLAGLLSVSTGFTATYGDMFFILLNDGADAINGTFNGLANNSVFSAGGQSFQISYFGDSGTNTFTGGNDAVLMAIPEPSAMLLGGLGVLALLRRRR
jgi:autotransporter-associated beta strand protein/T5SS/PEP-CTERM-associated repeat protein